VKLPQAASPQPSQVFSPLLLRPTTITAISGSILYRLPPIRVSDRAKKFGGTLGTALASRSFQEAGFHQKYPHYIARTTSRGLASHFSGSLDTKTFLTTRTTVSHPVRYSKVSPGPSFDVQRCLSLPGLQRDVHPPAPRKSYCY
jgi:hypothetical protein